MQVRTDKTVESFVQLVFQSQNKDIGIKLTRCKTRQNILNTERRRVTSKFLHPDEHFLTEAQINGISNLFEGAQSIS